MDFKDELKLRQELEEDRSKRDRGRFDFTVDALEQAGLQTLSIWPESNSRAKAVIEKRIDYDSLPFDELNDFYKGGLNTEQQDIILRNNGKEPLCEALDMQPCLKEGCPLYNTKLGPPVCREYKMVFRK